MKNIILLSLLLVGCGGGEFVGDEFGGTGGDAGNGGSAGDGGSGNVAGVGGADTAGAGGSGSGGSGGTACVPTTCEEFGQRHGDIWPYSRIACGDIDDGCGGQVRCGGTEFWLEVDHTDPCISISPTTTCGRVFDPLKWGNKDNICTKSCENIGVVNPHNYPGLCYIQCNGGNKRVEKFFNTFGCEKVNTNGEGAFCDCSIESEL